MDMKQLDALHHEFDRHQEQEFAKKLAQVRAETLERERRIAQLLTENEQDQNVLTGLALNHEVHLVRDAAGSRLGKLLTENEHDESVLTGLALNHEAHRVRDAAVSRLVVLLTDTEQDQNILFALALESRFDAVRHAAINKLDDPVVALSHLIEDSNTFERRYAATALKRVGGARSVEALCKALGDSDDQGGDIANRRFAATA